MSQRRGLGTQRHVDARYLWVQQKVQQKEVEVMKEKGQRNCADVLTKHVDARHAEFLIGLMGFHFVHEEHPTALKTLK